MLWQKGDSDEFRVKWIYTKLECSIRMSAATHYGEGCPKLTNKRPSSPITFLRFGGPYLEKDTHFI